MMDMAESRKVSAGWENQISADRNVRFFNNHIADFFKDGDIHFLITIHMGWLGWLAFDKVVDPFVANPAPAPAYKLLNDR